MSRKGYGSLPKAENWSGSAPWQVVKVEEHVVTRRKLQTPGNAEEHTKKKNKKHLQSTKLAQPTNLTYQGPSTTERTAWETHNTN